MKIHNVEQGSTEWLQLRLGIPTSSAFEKIVTPTGKLSTQARKYACYLVTEKLLNRSLDSISNLEWVARGKELEPDAVRQYEFDNDVKTELVGFVTTDDGRIGASPDRLIKGANAGLEVKCPAPHTHVEYMLDGFGKDYNVQVQGQLYVCEFDYVDRFSFNPDMPPVQIRSVRDEPFIRTLTDALAQFNDMKDEMLEKVRRLGLFAERQKMTTEFDEWAAEMVQ